jgi:hypothetical protein
MMTVSCCLASHFSTTGAMLLWFPRQRAEWFHAYGDKASTSLDVPFKLTTCVVLKLRSYLGGVDALNCSRQRLGG